MLRLAYLSCILATLPACGLLAQLPTGVADLPRPDPPTARVASAVLVSAPTETQLVGHYCPAYAPALVCRHLAPAPPPQALQFVFDVHVDVHNPNSIPLPAVEALALFTAFPDTTQDTLGAVCITMCTDPAQCPQQAAGACTAGPPEVRTLSDAANATASFLFAVATGDAALENLRVKTIPAGGDARVTFRLALDPTTVLSLLRTLAADAIAAVRTGRDPTFAIPYAIEGTLWLDVARWGRLTASLPPFHSTWTL